MRAEETSSIVDDAPTRERVATTIMENGPSTAAALAERLSLSDRERDAPPRQIRLDGRELSQLRIGEHTCNEFLLLVRPVRHARRRLHSSP